jgi:hypothetical protein
MLKLWSNGEGGQRGYSTFFTEGDNGGGSGGGGAASGASGDAAVATPFDDIDLDELDETTRTKIVEGKKLFVATLQRSTKLNTDLEHTQGLARRFQGEADRAKAEFLKVTGRGREGEPDPVLEGIRADLKASGYADADVEKMAPTFLRLYGTFGANLKKSIGTDLGPMAGKVLEQEATRAFEAAQSLDSLGMFLVPEVAERTWQLVQERIKAGSQTTPEIVANLAKMAFMDHASTKADAGEIIQLQKSTVPARKTKEGVNTNFTFPGASKVIIAAPQGGNPNDAKHPLNDDTQAALAQTFAEMGRGTGVRPKAFPEGSERHGRTR